MDVFDMLRMDAPSPRRGRVRRYLSDLAWLALVLVASC